MRKITGVIPARYASTRLPGKPLLDMLGKPMIQRVYERAKQAACLSRLIVATDDERIFETVRKFGGEVMMTSREARSGTERVVEVAGKVEGDIFINIQGDEPLLPPEMIGRVVELLKDEEVQIATLSRRLAPGEDPSNPNLVKVVTDRYGRALFFSRSAIPFFRNRTSLEYQIHTGIYCYTRAFLEKYRDMEDSMLEATESLEQLRWLENGYRIAVGKTEFYTAGVDTEEDYKRVVDLLRKIE